MAGKKILYNAFLRHFSPKNRTVLSGQRPHPLSDQKRFCIRSCVLWFVTTFVWKTFLYNAFLRHFSPKNRIVLSGQRPHPWADFAHMLYRPRFLSYKIAYQNLVELAQLFFELRCPQTDTQTDDMPKMILLKSACLKKCIFIKISKSIFRTNAILSLYSV